MKLGGLLESRNWKSILTFGLLASASGSEKDLSKGAEALQINGVRGSVTRLSPGMCGKDVEFGFFVNPDGSYPFPRPPECEGVNIWVPGPGKKCNPDVTNDVSCYTKKATVLKEEQGLIAKFRNDLIKSLPDSECSDTVSKSNGMVVGTNVFLKNEKDLQVLRQVLRKNPNTMVSYAMSETQDSMLANDVSAKILGKFKHKIGENLFVTDLVGEKWRSCKDDNDKSFYYPKHDHGPFPTECPSTSLKDSFFEMLEKFNNLGVR